MKKPEQFDQGGDEAKKGKKRRRIGDVETTNSDKSGDESETTDSVRMFDSDTPNQLEGQ